MNTIRALTILCFLISIIAATCHASVVGSGGKTYPIAEKDMLEVIEEAVAKVDHEKLQRDIQDSFKKQLKEFRLKDGVSALPLADKDMTYRVDLSFTITPELAQGLVDAYGRSIYKAGTKVNPLALMRKQGITYPFKLVIINGDRPAELAWFAKQKLNDNPMVKVLITDGKPMELASQFKRPVYQLTQKIRDRFQIQKTPSIVWWPEKSPYLAIKMFKVSDYIEEGNTHGQEHPSDPAPIDFEGETGSRSPHEGQSANGEGLQSPNAAQGRSSSQLSPKGTSVGPFTQGTAATLEVGNRAEQQAEKTEGTSNDTGTTATPQQEDLEATPIVEGHSVLDGGGPITSPALSGTLF